MHGGKIIMYYYALPVYVRDARDHGSVSIFILFVDVMLLCDKTLKLGVLIRQ